jgi:hypothetical protein
VETPAGLIPLRDLISTPNLEVEPPKPKNEPGLLEIPPAYSSPAAESQQPNTPEAPKSATQIPNKDSLNPDQAARLYTICGLCFLFPPLAGWSWLMANQLSQQGQQITAARIKWFSLGLACGGVLLWILLWRLW